MEIITMTNAMHKPRVLVACPQQADRRLLAAIRGLVQGTGVSALAIGGEAAARPATVAFGTASFATHNSTSDVAYIRTGRPPV